MQKPVVATFIYSLIIHMQNKFIFLLMHWTEQEELLKIKKVSTVNQGIQRTLLYKIKGKLQQRNKN